MRKHCCGNIVADANVCARTQHLLRNVSEFFQKHLESATNISPFPQQGSKTFVLIPTRLLAVETLRTTMFPQQCFLVYGALKAWQNEETCFPKHLYCAHVSPMFPSFAIRETLFPTTTFASEKQNMFLQHGRNIPCFRDAWKAYYPMLKKKKKKNITRCFPGNIMSARLRNIKLLYEAVSSADNSLTMVSKAPLSLLLFSHNRSGPFFRFPVLHPPKWPQRPQARH